MWSRRRWCRGCRTCWPPSPRRAGRSWRRPPARWATGCARSTCRRCCCCPPSGSPCSATRCSATRGCAAPAPTRTGTATTTGTWTTTCAIDVELAHAWADAIDAAGLQARRTRYDGFPIDTGTVTASRLLDPDGRGRWAIVSCNLYADPSAMGAVARAGVRAAGDRRVAVVAVSGLSSGLIPRWITPDQDRFENAEHDRWNRKVLDAIRAGADVGALAAEYARGRRRWTASSGRYAFLAGSGAVDGPGEVLAYGPVWGTGAAVVWWPRHGDGGRDGQGGGVHRGRGLRADLRRGGRDGEGHRGDRARGGPARRRHRRGGA